MLIPADRYVPPSGKRAIYYHTTWANYGRQFFVKDLPIDYITDISYAFFNVEPDGRVCSGDLWADVQNPFTGNGVEPQNAWDSRKEFLGNLGQFNKLRRQGKRFNLSLAIGGWTWSKNFSDAVLTPERRQTMVRSIVALFEEWPGLFNGVSLDWEYLSDDGRNYGNDGNVARKEDAENFIALLKLLRSSLGPGFSIGFCAPAAAEKLKIPLERIHPFLEEIHVMTYDFHDGAWGEAVSGHQTNLRRSPHGTNSVEEAVDLYLSRGVPPYKIFIGAALYSRGFANTDGLGRPCSGGSPDKSWEQGVVDYKALPLPGATEMFDNVACAAFSYDPVKRVLNSYDNPLIVTEKCRFVFERNLGGLLIWESSGDAPFGSERSIMRAIAENLTHGKPLPPVTELTP